MPAITNFSTFPAVLMNTYEDNAEILVDAVIDGVKTLNNDFNVKKCRNKAPLLTQDFIDAAQVAQQPFNPQTAWTVKTRLASFDSIDIDLTMTYADIKQYYDSYMGELMMGGKSLAEVRKNPFEAYFLKQIIKRHFAFFRTKTTWKGSRVAGPIGSQFVADGLNVKTAIGRAAGGDIPGSQWLAQAPMTVANAYAQVSAIIGLVNTNKPELLSGDLNCYMSQNTYTLYRQNRRALFPNTVGPDDKPTISDDYSNVNFVIDSGLAGKDTVLVTRKENLCVITNDSPETFSMNIVPQVKGFDINIRYELGMDYATPNWMFLNNLV